MRSRSGALDPRLRSGAAASNVGPLEAIVHTHGHCRPQLGVWDSAADHGSAAYEPPLEADAAASGQHIAGEQQGSAASEQFAYVLSLPFGGIRKFVASVLRRSST